MKTLFRTAIGMKYLLSLLLIVWAGISAAQNVAYTTPVVVNTITSTQYYNSSFTTYCGHQVTPRTSQNTGAFTTNTNLLPPPISVVRVYRTNCTYFVEIVDNIHNNSSAQYESMCFEALGMHQESSTIYRLENSTASFNVIYRYNGYALNGNNVHTHNYGFYLSLNVPSVGTELNVLSIPQSSTCVGGTIKISTPNSAGATVSGNQDWPYTYSAAENAWTFNAISDGFRRIDILKDGCTRSVTVAGVANPAPPTVIRESLCNPFIRIANPAPNEKYFFEIGGVEVQDVTFRPKSHGTIKVIPVLNGFT